MQGPTMGNNFNYLIKPSMASLYDDGTIENSPTLTFAYGAASMQGWRKKQEDKFTCLAKLCKNFSFFGVYDGHGGSEIAEYLQENLHLELKHFLESEEDVEMALYLGFLSADTTLKVPEIIAELNSKLDIENRGTSSEMRKKLFHNPKLLEELKKKAEKDTSSKESEEMEAKDTDRNTLPPNSTSQHPNAATSTKDSCSAGATPDASSGAAPDASSSGAAPDASSSGAAPDASSSGAAPDASSSGAAPDASSSGAAPDASSSGAAPDASSGATPEASSVVTQDLGAAGSAQDSHVVDLTQDSHVVDLTQDSDIIKLDKEMAAAGPSQEFDSSTEEDTEMEDDSIDEEMEDVTGETGKDEIEQPIEYLLNQELESSDSEDEDFSYGDEETESEGSNEGIKGLSTGSELTAEEFANIQPGDISGSTATVVLLNEKTIYVANVGDSRCVLSRKGEAMDMTIDHKPTDAEEQERIVLNGGTVRMGRINDTIDMSRAIGDFKLKCSSLIPSEQCVTAEPTVKSIPIEIDDEFLVIASDGIWNAMTSQEVVDYVHMRLKQENCDLRDICNELFELILSPDLENDSTGCDNMSCVIIKFIQRGIRYDEAVRLQKSMESAKKSLFDRDYTLVLQSPM